MAALAGLSVLGAVVVGAGGWAVVSLLRSPRPVAAPAGSSGPALPQTIQEIVEAARAYMDQDKAASAEVILSAAVERFPESQMLSLLLGECLLQQDRMGEAYDFYARGIFIGPDHPEYRFVAGTLASKLGRLEDAETHYKVSQSLAPSNPKFPLYLAQVQRRAGKVDDARANLIIATKLDETLGIAWASLAAIALDENRLDVARQYVERARRLEPENAAFRIIEAKALRRDAEPERALAVLMEIPEGDRLRSPGVLLEMSLCYGMLGKTSEPAGMYVAAVAADPKDFELLYQAALWLDRDGQRERAEVYARNAANNGHEGARRLVEEWEKGARR